jgi:hypothetical protein
VALAWMESFWVNYPGVTDAETACNDFVVYSRPLEQQGLGSLLYLVDTIGGSGGASGCVVTNSAGSCTVGATSTGTTANPDTNASQGSLSVYPTSTGSGWPKPSWQTNASIPGLPNDGVRDIPDVSFFASDGFLSSSAYLVCASDVTTCSFSSKSAPIFLEVGGTSVATPTMAGVMGLVNQKTGAAQGNPNAELYKLAASQSYSNCSAERGNGAPVTSSSCLFNDIDTGTNAMACDYDAYVNSPSPNCTRIHSSDVVGILPGYSAVRGYDLATGLGSLNVANVVNAWTATVGAGSTTVSVAPGQNSIASSQSLAVTVTVASSPSGGTTPTGTVTLSSGVYTSSAQSLSGGTTSFTIPGGSLSAGTDTLTAQYGGDGNYAASSGTATVTVTAPALLPATVTVSPASSTLNSNVSLSVTATVSGSGVTPTGTVTLSGGGYTSSAQSLVSGIYTFVIPAGSLNSGSDTLTVTYSGDGNYGTASSTATVTVTESTFSLTATSPTASIAPGASATSTLTVAAVAGYGGTVTLTCQETDPSPSTGDGAACTIPTTAVAMGGTATATVTTTAAVAELAYPNVHGKGNGWAGAGGGAVLAFLVFLGIPARRRSWRAMLGMLVLMGALGSLTSCGGGGSSNSGGSGNSDPGTAAGTYTFKVQATGNPSVTPAVSTTFTVTVN